MTARQDALCKNMINEISDKELYLEFRKTYMMLLKMIIGWIEDGDQEAAKQYEELEDSWGNVELWNTSQKQ